VMLLDSAHIQQSDSQFHNKKRKQNHLPPIDPLYTPDDVPGALKLFEAVDYEKWFDVHPGVSVLFRDNGHILGSGSVNLVIKNNNKTTRIGFSGDIGRPNRPILKDPITMEPCDYLISESTYGGRLHEKFPDDLETFQKIIEDTCFQRKGKVIIPAFSIGRTQELVYMLNKMDDKQLLQNLPVYVDSPLSTNATEIYRRHPECFDEEIKTLLQTDPNPFGFNNLKYITEVDDSKALNGKTDPCIIISASGMAEAGRIVHHLANNIEDEKNTILIVGYCGEGTLGRRIHDGQNPVRILGIEHPVKAQVAIMDSFSAHGDQKEMLDFLKPLATNDLKKTFLVHGDYDEGQLPFQKCLSENGWNAIEIPVPGQIVELV
jgi:metallo-beta-lactamase family protein